VRLNINGQRNQQRKEKRITMSTEKHRAPRNRTVSLTDSERRTFSKRLIRLDSVTTPVEIYNRTINQDLFEVLPHLPSHFVDLLIVDPPYNLNKLFNENPFKARSIEDYMTWIESWLSYMRRILKPDASVYICCDWRCSSAIQRVAERYFIPQNRITWEREKGRGANKNWKNCSEDIWFFTVSSKYTFNLESVKLKRRVLAPYTHENGAPKDWSRTEDGDFRLTHPSNLWTDISVPFWSMPENTDHPTQKPEKLIAKLILASSNVGEVIFDPFLGSGTTSVVAKKLNRKFVGIEIDETYSCLAEKRLDLAERDASIQGYHDNVFWERNTLADQKKEAPRSKATSAMQRQLGF
jgi:site-specific DNA-methyltransferase (adenine-specific)